MGWGLIALFVGAAGAAMTGDVRWLLLWMLALPLFCFVIMAAIRSRR